MTPTLPPCEHRESVNDEQFYCARWQEWFLTTGLECWRCRAGLPVTVEAYKQYIRQQRGRKT